jgi:hypothetical protein
MGEEKRGVTKFLTKFTVAGAVGEWAVTYPMDFEAGSAEKAADLASDYWRANWAGPAIVTQAVIQVHRYLPNSKEIDESPVLVVLWAKAAKKGD